MKNHIMIPGLAMSTKYTYRIKAYNESGSSDWYEETATSVGLQKNFITAYISADTMVRKQNSSTNYGALNYIEISGANSYLWGGLGEPSLSYGLLLFDLPVLPKYAVDFNSAYFYMYDADSGNASYNVPIDIYAGLTLDPWKENTVTWDNRPGTFLSDKDGPLAYTLKGPDDAYNHVESIKMDISRLASYWYSGEYPNYGLMLFTKSDNIFWDFYSKEIAPGATSLEVYYTW